MISWLKHVAIYSLGFFSIAALSVASHMPISVYIIMMLSFALIGSDVCKSLFNKKSHYDELFGLVLFSHIFIFGGNVSIYTWLTRLSSGSHGKASGEYCVMEAVSKAACEPFSDHPQTACPVLTSFMIRLNDSMNDDERCQLKPYVSKLLNTRDGKSSKRLEILVHTAVAEVTPHALDLTKNKDLIHHASILRKLSPGDYGAAARAAGVAAGAVAGVAAGAVARAARAAGVAAGAAAGATAGATAGAAWAAEAAAGAAWATAENRQVYWDMCLKAVDKCLDL